MSHYRKILVDDITYEYVVGRYVTKIKGSGTYPHLKWAYVMNIDEGRFIVSPHMVKGMIKNVPNTSYPLEMWNRESEAIELEEYLDE